MTAAAKSVSVSSIAPRRHDVIARASVALLLSATIGTVAIDSAEAATPKIRTSSQNVVPACVTPNRLMAFLKQRNSRIEPRFETIADWYKRHGETWRVRWDYAFFQMAVETNFLSYKRSNGSWGDARPKQNNFAGLGTTGGGVPGDSYPDVGTGVLAQIQHLVVYSGEHIPSPVGPRTKLKQDVILRATGSKKGRMTFADLAGRWAADKHYGAAIEWVAGRYRKIYCRGLSDAALQAQAPKMPLPRARALGGPTVPKTQRAAAGSSAPVRTIWSREMRANQPVKPEPPQVPAESADVIARAVQKPTAPPVQTPKQIQIAMVETEQSPSAAPSPAEGAAAENLQAFAFAGRLRIASADTAASSSSGNRTCSVVAASYGGNKTLLVRGAETSGAIKYTILTVLAGFERSMLDSYLRAHAPGGTSLGAFDSKDAAIAKARELCPNAVQATQAQGTRAG